MHDDCLVFRAVRVVNFSVARKLDNLNLGFLRASVAHARCQSRLRHDQIVVARVLTS